ncbi:MAG: cyclic nucleotide-binding domain-containing protein, partial [Thermoanaerobaculia bacterium]|nr:cyclic nucleotide-binding domain-containing protein [Thermoanaerobaculia bacterium]
MHDLLLRHITRQVSLSAPEQDAVRTRFQARNLKKKEFLLQAGDVCRTEHFVVQGCLRAYVIDTEGKEHIIQFAVEEWWIGDMRSFVREVPAEFFIEAMENCTLLVIDKPGLE